MNPKPSVIKVSHQCIKNLDLTPFNSWANASIEEILRAGAILSIQFDWARPTPDPRELSEYPDVRLWSLHADSTYPWLPLILERSTGQLARHVAMLLPHQFSQQDGLRFGSESLELWTTHRLLTLDRWSLNDGLSARGTMIQMSRALGYELDPSFWIQLDSWPEEDKKDQMN
uniref:DUF1817 domain-containing protein n=1 Tax=Paulinella longichromatophora TaxID=1708747 RepID=A0A2H4ZQS5_9EUKA|nr:hypothetical protein PLO_891 [Paulinella longichromatophora]